MQPKDHSNDLLSFGEPVTTNFTGPDNNRYTIREQNGEDEDIISRNNGKDFLEPLHKYLSRIILSPGLSTYEVANLPSRVKYYILIKARIFSLGNIVSFDHEFKDGTKLSFEQDLNEFIFDFDSDEPFPENPSPLLIPPYEYSEANETYVEFKLSSGVTCRFNYANGLAEKKILGIPEKELSINTELIVRDFQFKGGDGSWNKIENFKTFSSRLMSEIRKVIREKDPTFTGLVEVRDGDKKEFVNIIAVPDFFFPAAM